MCMYVVALCVVNLYLDCENMYYSPHVYNVEEEFYYVAEYLQEASFHG